MLKKLENQPIMFYLASFLLPLFIIIIALIGLHVAPFGDKTLFIADARALYLEYLSFSSRLVQGLEGFLYSFEKGLGGNMIPHIGGTMSNPVFALATLFDLADYSIAFTLISATIFCTCGLTMYIFLADLFGHKRSNLIFSTTYALSGFFVANVFQIIFFTGCQALPLMAKGLRKVFKGKISLLYIFSIVYATVTSFYFGFTLCVFSFLSFLVFFFLNKDELEGKRIPVLLNYGISSLCAGLIPTFIWLPAYLGIQGGRANQTSISDFSFWEKMPFIEIFSKLFTGANTSSQLIDGLPNIYIGLLPVVLVILFFMNKKISSRMKLIAAIIIGFYLLGFYIIAFDMLLHGGTTTNWFNFRYSYIFSFVLLVIAAYEWQYIDDVSFKDIKNCFIGLLISILLIFSKKYEYVMGSEVLLDVVLLLLIFGAYRLYRLKPQFNPKHTFEALTILIVSISLYLNYTICTKNISDQILTDQEYRQTVNAVNPLVTTVKENDDEFYRMEINHQLSMTCGNDPMLYGYNGVGHGGSNERDFVREELFKLGVQWYDMRNYYSQGIPAATDTLLGIKYLIADEDMSKEKGYQRITDMKGAGLDFGDSTVYDLFKNTNSLPISFVSSNKVNELELTDDNLFDNLNQVWKAVSGENKSVFVEENNISFKTLNLSASSELEAEDARKIVQKYDQASSDNESESSTEIGTSSSEATENVISTSDFPTSGYNYISEVSSSSDASSTDLISYNLIMDEDPMFVSSIEFSFISSQDGPVYVYHRGALVQGQGSAESLVKYMGYYHKGDVVKGYLSYPSDYVNKVAFEEYAGRFRAAYADLDVLKYMSNVVKMRPSTLEKIKDSHLKGTMTVKKGQELLFTIPWDEGWTCYVDGEETELTKVLGVFMVAEVAPGEHIYEMKYVPPGMNLGIKISSVALVLMLLYILFARKYSDRKLIKKVDSDSPNRRESLDVETGSLKEQKETSSDDSI